MVVLLGVAQGGGVDARRDDATGDQAVRPEAFDDPLELALEGEIGTLEDRRVHLARGNRGQRLDDRLRAVLFARRCGERRVSTSPGRGKLTVNSPLSTAFR